MEQGVLNVEKMAAIRDKIKHFEEDKRKLIAQLIDYEELKDENERRKRLLVNRTKITFLPTYFHNGIF